MHDAQTVKNESLLMKNFVKAWHERFFDKDLAHPEWPAARTAKHIPKPHLNICDPGSITEALYTNANITGSSIKH